MALRDPVAIYDAASNVEALFVRDALTAAGVEAFVIEDVSQAGTWVGGLIPGIHKPQVWVERSDVERAKPILIDFDARAAQLRNAGSESSAAGPPIEVVCEDCGERSSYAATQRGSVQQCPHCGGYVDVGEAELPESWFESDDETGTGVDRAQE